MPKDYMPLAILEVGFWGTIKSLKPTRKKPHCFWQTPQKATLKIDRGIKNVTLYNNIFNVYFSGITLSSVQKVFSFL